MRNVVQRLATLHLGINDPERVLEEGRQTPAGEVAVLVDGAGEYRATVLAEPGGVVGAAPEKRNAIGSAADDHGPSLARSWSAAIQRWPSMREPILARARVFDKAECCKEACDCRQRCDARGASMRRRSNPP